MLTRAWHKAERCLLRALKLETAPPYSSAFSTDSQLATIPTSFEQSKYPGLLFIHFVRDTRPSSCPTVLAYWMNEASFEAARASLTKDLSLGTLVSSGLVSDLRHGERTLLQRLLRLSLREAVIGASTVVGAILLILNFAGDAFSYLFAAPRIDILVQDKPIDVLENTHLSLPLKLRSRLSSRNVEVDADPSDSLRLEPANLATSAQLPRPGPLRLEVEGGRPPLLPAGQTIDVNLRLATGHSSGPLPITLPKAETSDPRPDQFHLKGSLLATRDGWIWPRLRYEVPSSLVRLWSKLQCARRVELASTLDSRPASKVAFSGRIHAGEARDAVRVYVEAINFKNVDMSANDGDRLISQEHSFDGSVKVLEWTRPVRAFTESTFSVILESKDARSKNDWQTLGGEISVVCR